MNFQVEQMTERLDKLHSLAEKKRRLLDGGGGAVVDEITSKSNPSSAKPKPIQQPTSAGRNKASVTAKKK